MYKKPDAEKEKVRHARTFFFITLLQLFSLPYNHLNTVEYDSNSSEI